MKKYALITGASEGIGRAIAYGLASIGLNLVLTARSADKLNALKVELLHIYPQLDIQLLAFDLSQKNELNLLIEGISARTIFISILVNNLGIYEPGNFFEEADAVFEKMMFINTFVPYFLCKTFGKEMAIRQEGHIFGIVSIAGKTPVADAMSYSVSKFAHYGLMQNLRLELKKSNVHVTSILPGSTLTSSWGDTQIDPKLFIQANDIALSLVSCLKLTNGANVDEINISPLNF